MLLNTLVNFVTIPSVRETLGTPAYHSFLDHPSIADCRGCGDRQEVERAAQPRKFDREVAQLTRPSARVFEPVRLCSLRIVVVKHFPCPVSISLMDL